MMGHDANAQTAFMQMGLPLTLEEANRLQRAFVDLPNAFQEAAQAMDVLSAVVASGEPHPDMFSGLITLAARSLAHLSETHGQHLEQLEVRLGREIYKFERSHDDFANLEGDRSHEAV